MIVEAIGLGVDGMNFYRDRKVLDKVMIEFVETTKERNYLVKISNSYFSSNRISSPWRFVYFVLIKYVTLMVVSLRFTGITSCLSTIFDMELGLISPSSPPIPW